MQALAAVAPSRPCCWRPTARPQRQQQQQRPLQQRCRAEADESAAGPSPQPPPLTPPPPQQQPVLSERAVLARTAAAQEEEAAAADAKAGDPGLGSLKWAQQYKLQIREAAAAATAGSAAPAEDTFLLPLMTLRKCKLPTESVPLQIFEPRYRLLFKLVSSSANRRFGVVLADSSSGMMESVGALCELTHFVAVPERRRLFVNARVCGRFRVEAIVGDKPFVAVLASHHTDDAPTELSEQLQLAALELRVWETMQEVRRLATKLFANGGSPFGNDIFSMEVRRWSPDAAARASVPTAPGADPTLMRMVQLAGLLGEEESVAERTTEYVTSDALRQVGEDERRERFSFALARTLDLGPEGLQQLLYTQSTAERLRAAEALILEGRNYLAARSTLRDSF